MISEWNPKCICCKAPFSLGQQVNGETTPLQMKVQWNQRDAALTLGSNVFPRLTGILVVWLGDSAITME